MCLGIPGRVIEWICRESVSACALVEFEGIRSRIQMACVPEANIGDFVIVHAGIAIARVNEQEALRTLEELRSLAEFHESGGSDAVGEAVGEAEELN
ncbi:MAG: HypC/HybG/HupF family hydrogenase formation chaperone [Planctomyces sp.]|nr:HypC/HybG/HupF family hydrogenase formation chaperone [Planctomyces sp.]